MPSNFRKVAALPRELVGVRALASRSLMNPRDSGLWNCRSPVFGSTWKNSPWAVLKTGRPFIMPATDRLPRHFWTVLANLMVKAAVSRLPTGFWTAGSAWVAPEGAVGAFWAIGWTLPGAWAEAPEARNTPAENTAAAEDWDLLLGFRFMVPPRDR